MSLDYLNEAFKRLELLTEEAFDTSLDGINNLSNFMDEDDASDSIKIIDPEAESDEDLQDSYIGKVITNCNVCHSHVFEDKSNIVIDEDGVVNSEQQCPYCGEASGFVIVGEITHYDATKDESEKDNITVEVDGKEVTPTEEENIDSLDESVLGTLALAGAAGAVGGAASALTQNVLGEDEDKNEEENTLTERTATLDRPDVTQISGTVADVLNSHSADINACGANEAAVKSTITRILSSGEVRNEQDAEEAIRIINNCRGPKLWSTIGTYMSGMKVASTGRYKKDRLYASLEEDVNNVNVETDDSVVNVSTDEGGKVVVSTEPRSPELTDEEALGPVSDETISEIEAENNISDEDDPQEGVEEPVEDTDSETDVEIDEVDEASLDELGESYLKHVYENVQSFKTSGVSSSERHLVVEGVITFKSGIQKQTGFIFEACSVTRDGKVSFKGKNEHFSRGSKAFTLVGRVADKKLISESFTYNYRAKTSEGKSSRIYGTVTTNK